MVGSTYVSDPEVWRKFYKNMLNGKFYPGQYRGRQTGGAGIAGMYANRPYMIPVNRHIGEEEEDKIVVGKQVTPVAAAVERAKSEHRDAVRENVPHVPINKKKVEKPVSSKGTAKRATSKRKPETEEPNLFNKKARQ